MVGEGERGEAAEAASRTGVALMEGCKSEFGKVPAAEGRGDGLAFVRRTELEEKENSRVCDGNLGATHATRRNETNKLLDDGIRDLGILRSEVEIREHVS